jgi:hypothetical protein
MGVKQKNTKTKCVLNRSGPSNCPIYLRLDNVTSISRHTPCPPTPHPTQRIKLNYCSSSRFIPTPLLPPCRHVKADRSATSRRCGFVLGHLTLGADPPRFRFFFNIRFNFLLLKLYPFS